MTRHHELTQTSTTEETARGLCVCCMCVCVCVRARGSFQALPESNGWGGLPC